MTSSSNIMKHLAAIDETANEAWTRDVDRVSVASAKEFESNNPEFKVIANSDAATTDPDEIDAISQPMNVEMELVAPGMDTNMGDFIKRPWDCECEQPE